LAPALLFFFAGSLSACSAFGHVYPPKTFAFLNSRRDLPYLEEGPAPVDFNTVDMAGEKLQRLL
jgi:hypothetical protein